MVARTDTGLALVPSFTTSRRRVIAALALTSALMITLDLQGNSAVGSVRRGFGAVFSPFEDAARVVTRPVENAWRGVRDYPDVAEENRRLKEQLAQQEADHLLWQAERQDYAEAMAAANLDTSFGTPILARVIGDSPSNFDQTVEIDKGSNDGLEIGQMVVAGGQTLVGKITEVQSDRATVMLATDARFSVAVKVENAPDEVPTEDSVATGGEAPADSSVPEGEESTTTTAVEETTTTTTLPAETTTTLPGNAQPNDPLAPPTTAAPETTPDATVPQARQNGSLEGRGPERNPYVVRVSDSPRFGQIEIGAIVRTSGGSIAGESLAPANLLVGTVLKRIEQAGSGGDVLEIRPSAVFSSLDFVAVLPRPGG